MKRKIRNNTFKYNFIYKLFLSDPFMSDMGEVELVWDKPTKVFREAKRYFRNNPDFSEDYVPETDSERFAHQLAKVSYCSHRDPVLSYTKYNEYQPVYF